MLEPENKLTTNPPQGETALLVRSETEEESQTPNEDRDKRLDRLRMQLDVMVKVQTFRVGDLLALTRGAVIETIHEHSQDVPVRCSHTLLMWSEFEVVEQKLAVRITRLA